MDERLRFIARLLEGEKMAPLCRIVARLLKAGFTAIQQRGQPAYGQYIQTFGDLVSFNRHIHALVLVRFGADYV
jgi:hypothetical protein